MPDLLAHVLVGFALFEVASWRIEGIDRPAVATGVVGSILPDLAKVRLVLSSDTVGDLLRVPFSWFAVHRLGGALALSAIGALLVAPSYRRRVFGLLASGAGLHLFLDGLISRANGLAPPYFYPFSWWQPPAGGLYVSSDHWPTFLALALALAVWVVGRRRA